MRTIAVAKIRMPALYVRRSANREQISEAAQALCFLAGANSIFYADQLLISANPTHRRDRALLEKLGMPPEASPRYSDIGPAAARAPSCRHESRRVPQA